MKPAGIARYVLHGTSEERRELLERNRKLVKLRWFYQTILSTTAIVASFTAGLPLVRIWQYLAITIVVFFINGILFLACRREQASLKYYQLISLAQILLDLVVATIVTMMQGSEARTAILFVIPIINAALMFGSRQLVTAASLLSTLGYSYAILASSFVETNVLDFNKALLPIVFYGMLFFVIGRLLLYFHDRSVGESRDQAYSELLALLSHQLRHPVSTISAIVDTLEVDKNLTYDKATARYIGVLKKENNRQTHLINNLLEVVNTETPSGRLQVTDVRRLLGEAMQSLGIVHKRANDLKLTVEADGFVGAHGSPEKLRMVFDNLLDNALRYSKKGVKVETNVLVSSTRVIITISDHGVGILPSHRRRLFEKFGNTAALDGEIHGAGLGMYVSEKIVHAYGGELTVRSSVGGGTQVTIKLRRIDND